MRKFFIYVFMVWMSLSAIAFARTDNYVRIVSLDGFRWDYLQRGLTPRMQELIQNGVQALTFEPTFPSKTFPNHLSIVTGLYIENHGILYNRFFNPFSGEKYAVGDTTSVRSDFWYRGETLWETARRNGLMSASFYWPGSETKLSYKHPDYFKVYDESVPHKTRIDTIIHWLTLPESQRPHLLFLYFNDTDSWGHKAGPVSQEINKAITTLDHWIGYLSDQLKRIAMFDKVNLIILSDHGMTQLNPTGRIFLPDILKEAVKIVGYGPFIQFYPRDSVQEERIYRRLKAQEKTLGYRVYKREDFPAYLHYSHHPFMGKIFALADLGNTFVVDEKQLRKMARKNPQGDHGYDNREWDMQGIFIGHGPGFKKGYRVNHIKNVDVYPLVCRLLGMVGNQKIDGKLERVEAVLK